MWSLSLLLTLNVTRHRRALEGGNTPIETFNGMTIDISKHTQNFNEQKALRRQLNKQSRCKVCL